MFGIKSLFSKEEPVEKQIIELLSGYRSAIFPMGIQSEWIKQTNKESDCWQVRIELPFAARSQTALIQSYLAEHLKVTTNIVLDTQLPEAYKFKKIKHIILVASGKGGVGKSTTAVNFALALQSQGANVGLLDADIYGPSIPSLLGLVGEQPTAKDDKMLNPMEKYGLKTMSIGYLVPAESATVWRGPMASQALNQLLNETDWGDLDYLIVDMPPGTGDIQLTMTQKLPASGAVIVTTPQDLALADAQKGIAMFSQVNLPIIGLVENMSFFNCTHCGEKNHLFGQDGGNQLAARHGVPLLAEIPLDVNIREESERGANFIENASPITEHYTYCAQLVSSMLFLQSHDNQGVKIVVTDD
ncbi:iron-sulfur cluster carrier protein ApbC [Pseudoalteromonas luteoviolacea]|uniref:iron-sulfur cluster carrier protein ApbC n=1 Tax=Pseudoalteromonas luteoviolacea TaxID=43657 RepID=UPI001151986D|nr:iron-sulfur cluster carrier protein ApbC [Pseudoalteromonas luteoviolacea]TQF71014.1 iron-sulfur cluster carrier protein ApbC [Pseudoalteromonas luteoviolacea]